MGIKNWLATRKETEVLRSIRKDEDSIKRLTSLERQERFRLAFQYDDIPVMKSLMRYGVEPAQILFDPVSDCIMEKKPRETLQFLLDTGKMDVKRHGTSWLMLAVDRKDMELARMAIAAGVRDAQHAGYGHTCLYLATKKCDLPFIELIGFEAGGAPHELNSYHSESALKLAHDSGYADAEALLLRIDEFRKTGKKPEAANDHPPDEKVEAVILDFNAMGPSARTAALLEIARNFPEEFAAASARALPAPEPQRQLAPAGQLKTEP